MSEPVAILLVEDNPGDARLFGELLAESELAADHRTVESLQDGLRALRDDRPDVIVADLGLPDSQGTETVRRLRDASPGVPLVVLTGQQALESATAALEAGASEYLPKNDLTPALLARTLRLALERHRLEQEADRQRALSRAILESLSEHIAVLDPAGRILDTNRSWTSFAASEGGDPRGYVGDDYLEVTRAAAEQGSADAAEMLEGLRGVLEDGRDHFEMEYPCHGPDEKRWFRVTVAPLQGAEGGGAVVSHIDITERRLAEQKLRRSRERHVRAQRMAELGHWQLDLESGRFARSDQFPRILGVDADALDASADAFLDRVHPEDRDRLRDALDDVIEDGGVLDERIRVIRADGEARWLHDQAEYREGRGGEPDRIEGTIQDITRRIRREQELQRASHALRERVKEQSCIYDVMWLLHVDEREWEQRLQSLVDRLPEGWQYPDVAAARLQLGDDTWVSAEFRETPDRLSAPISRDGAPVGRAEVVYLEDRPPADTGPFLGEEEQLLHSVADQIALALERRRTRRELKAERRRLSEVFENAPAWVATFRGPEHVFEMANPAYRELVGGRELVGRPVRDVLPELEGSGYFKLLDDVFETGETVEVQEKSLTLENEPGRRTTRYIRFVCQPRREAGEVVGVLAHGVDITEQVRRRKEARKAEEKWATALDLAPVGIVISDAGSGRLDAVNEAFEQIFGYDAAEMVGRTSLELGHWEDPERRDEIVARVQERGIVEGEEAGFRTAGGRRGRMRVSCRRLELAGEDRLLWTVEDVTEARERQERLYLLESAVDATDHGLVITDRDGAIVWANPAFEEMTGYGLEEARGENLHILKSGDQSPDFYEELWDTILAGDSWQGELVNRRKDGTHYEERMSIVPVRHDGEEVTHFIALKTDITEEKQREEALRESEARYRTLVETMAEAVVIVDPGGHLVFANENAAELFGVPAGELTARTFDDPDWQITDVDGAPLPDEEYPFRRVLREKRTVRGVEHAVQRPDGSRQIISVNAAPLWNVGGEFEGMVTTIRDVTEQHRMQEQLRHRALHDPLTDLANRTLFHDRLEQALTRAGRRGEAVGVFVLDLDRFKQINDHLGHTAGDRVLEELARRLREAVRDEDTVARLGGDEFGVVLPAVGGKDGTAAVRDRMERVLARPYRIADQKVQVDVTIGGVVVCTCELNEAVEVDDPADAARYAQLALYRAKETPGPSFHLFHPREDGERAQLLGREQELRRAIRREEFEVYFQPILRLDDGRVWGVEPLARWRHPDRGLVSPGEFIPLAEETGLVHDLGKLLLRETCREVASWNGTIPDTLRITPNLSGRQFDRDDLAPVLFDIVEGEGLDPSRFDFEITESAITRATGTVEELRNRGFRVIVDDFGTGFSSFHYLRDMRYEGLKIDMSFVHGVEEEGTNRALVETMITMGRTMSMGVVAEGIETERQLAALRELGCPLGQGYLFARPMPASETRDRLREAARQSFEWTPMGGGGPR